MDIVSLLKDDDPDIFTKKNVIKTGIISTTGFILSIWGIISAFTLLAERQGLSQNIISLQFNGSHWLEVPTCSQGICYFIMPDYNYSTNDYVYINYNSQPYENCSITYQDLEYTYNLLSSGAVVHGNSSESTGVSSLVETMGISIGVSIYQSVMECGYLFGLKVMYDGHDGNWLTKTQVYRVGTAPGKGRYDNTYLLLTFICPIIYFVLNCLALHVLSLALPVVYLQEKSGCPSSVVTLEQTLVEAKSAAIQSIIQSTLFSILKLYQVHVHNVCKQEKKESSTTGIQ